MSLKPVVRTQALGLLLSFCLFFPLFSPSHSFADSTIQKDVSCKTALVDRQKPFLSPQVGVQDSGKIDLSLTQKPGALGKITNFVAAKSLGPLFKVPKLEETMVRLQASLKDPSQADVPYFQKVLNAFQINYHFDKSFLAEIPKTGPLLVTLNHPLSGLELLAVGAAIQKVRPDVKVIATKFLENVPDLQKHSILVDNMGGPVARAYNFTQRERIVESLNAGEVLIISPAGAVSVKEKLSDEVAIDPPWKLGVADFISKVPGTQVLPVFVGGGPSQAFHMARKIHPFAGTAMILREIANLVGTDMNFAFGKVINPEELSRFKDRTELVKYLRARTYLLAEALHARIQKVSQPPRQRKEPVADPIPTEDIERELSTQEVIYDMAPDSPSKGMRAYLALGRDIPLTVNELGRLREITFWKAGEGTGRGRDLDKFDSYYFHLIAWDKKKNCIAGAYRIGLTDKLIKEYGEKGTYTSNYFGVGPLLNTSLARMIEVGRSFVLPEYQGRSFALPTLFGGIGRFLASRPEYEGFFGAVSVSNQYKETSKVLILKWAEIHAGAAEFGQISSNNPPVFQTLLSKEDINLLIKYSPEVSDLNQLVASSEGSLSARAPQLIQIYRDLGAKFLAFDKDTDFNTVDGLIYTSIRNLSHEDRVKYMGEDGAANFEAHWGL